ncbi:hypothetical protein BIU88_12755 [Chlorobaculum limnaeum]|uniref:Peptidase S1 n=1 Tax=Chlorobaculum limnaeum TaxID=274537 RepID=A0A1D8D187_CHLLM|nr:hypothetical protein [Chlorobaculum limnaeum]AOS84922.1 hypothetical protein BIU88_12755 [Chlorobaculum limnaeum]
MKEFLPSALLALMLSLPTVCRGEMIVRDYAPARHERFYQGSGNDFVGKRYDFSGIGLGSSGHWATLVSANCFLSANHLHPAVGETVTFWATNRLTEARFTCTVTGGVRIGTSDLWIGWFDKAVDASIARYPIPLQPLLNRYVGLELFNYGMRHRVGRNVLEVIATYSHGGATGITAGYDYDNNDTPAVGGDETFLRVGDSGAPSFAVFNSRLALIGIHWSVTRNPDSSIDTFVPEYFDEIDKVLKKRGQALRWSR